MLSSTDIRKTTRSICMMTSPVVTGAGDPIASFSMELESLLVSLPGAGECLLIYQPGSILLMRGSFQQQLKPCILSTLDWRSHYHPWENSLSGSLGWKLQTGTTAGAPKWPLLPFQGIFSATSLVSSRACLRIFFPSLVTSSTSGSSIGSLLALKSLFFSSGNSYLACM